MATRKKGEKPWDFLEAYRGKQFKGSWPTVVEMFEISVDRYAENKCFTAFVPKHETFTYKEVHKYVLSVADYLASKGVKKDDKIAVIGKNSPEWAIAYLGILFCWSNCCTIGQHLDQ